MNTRVMYLATLYFVMCHTSLAEVLPKNLIQGLASDQFARRESAQYELLAWSLKRPAEAIPMLLSLSRKNQDPEVRKRSFEILRSLADTDYLSDGQGYLGILMQEEFLEVGGEGNGASGIRVLDVMKESPAEQANLRQGDVIVSLDGVGWEGFGAVTKFGDVIAAKKPLVDVTLKVRRGEGVLIDIIVRLGKRPIPDLRMAGGDLGLLEEQAKERHFKDWLSKQREE